MDIHANIGNSAKDIKQKTKIIVGLLVEMEIMMEAHGVIHLVRVEVGRGVIYQYVEVRQSIPIQIYRSGVEYRASATLWEKHKRYSETDIFKVIDFLIDVKHFFVFGGHIFQHFRQLTCQ